MTTGTGLLALAVTAAVGAAEPGDEVISYQFRVLTMEGLNWRTQYYSRLQAVARQGTSTIWTADRALAETLGNQAKAASASPKCIATGESTIDQRGQTHYVAHLDRVADGPKNQASSLAFVPEVAVVEEGFRASVVGRKLDQGILTRVALEESHVKAIHTVGMDESFAPSSKPVDCDQSCPQQAVKTFLKTMSDATFGKADPSIRIRVQVPEVSNARVEGEWLIPNDSVLLISLGVETVADEKGMAKVLERVAVIEAGGTNRGVTLSGSSFGNQPLLAPVPELRAEAMDANGQFVAVPQPEAVSSNDLNRINPEALPVVPRLTSVPGSMIDAQVGRTSLEAPPALRMAMPALPARSIPEAVDLYGQVVTLPPLPEPVASSDPNQPSPQSSQVEADTIRDPAVGRTSFDLTYQPVEKPTVDPMVSPASTIMTGLIEAIARVATSMATPEEKPPISITAEDVSTPIEKSPVDSQHKDGLVSKKDKSEMTVGISLKDPSGSKVFDSVTRLEAVLKEPGKTETQYIPISEKFSLEIKAKLVPSPSGSYKELGKIEGPTMKR